MHATEAASYSVAPDHAAPAAMQAPPPVSQASPHQWIMTALALMCTMLWAGAQIGVKYGLQVSPPLFLMGLRFTFASAILVPVALLTGARWPANRAAWGRTCLLGLLNNTLYLGLTAIGLNGISAGLCCVLTGINPLGLALGGWWAFGERLTWRVSTGLFGALMGVVWVMWQRLGADNTLFGALMVLAANAVMVVGNLCYKRWQADCGLLVNHLVQLAVGGLSLLAISWNTELWAQVQWGPQFWLAQSFLVVGVSFGAMLTWLFLLSRGSASQAGAFLFLVPMFGLAQGALLLHEPLSASDLWGVAFTTACIYLAQTGQPAAR